MHPRTEELLNFLLTSQIRLREAVDAVPPAKRHAEPPPGRWSVGQVLEHLAIVESGIARLIRKRVGDARAAGLGAEQEVSSVLWSLDVARVLDRNQRLEAPERVMPKQQLGADEAWHHLATANADARLAVSDTDGLAIGGITQPHPSLGTLNLYQWIVFIGAHELRHAAQIREI